MTTTSGDVVARAPRGRAGVDDALLGLGQSGGELVAPAHRRRPDDGDGAEPPGVLPLAAVGEPALVLDRALGRAEVGDLDVECRQLGDHAGAHVDRRRAPGRGGARLRDDRGDGIGQLGGQLVAASAGPRPDQRLAPWWRPARAGRATAAPATPSTRPARPAVDDSCQRTPRGRPGRSACSRRPGRARPTPGAVGQQRVGDRHLTLGHVAGPHHVGARGPASSGRAGRRRHWLRAASRLASTRAGSSSAGGAQVQRLPRAGAARHRSGP